MDETDYLLNSVENVKRLHDAESCEYEGYKFDAKAAGIDQSTRNYGRVV